MQESLRKRCASFGFGVTVVISGCGGISTALDADASHTMEGGARFDATAESGVTSDAAMAGRDSPGDAAACSSVAQGTDCRTAGQICTAGTSQCECETQVDASSVWSCVTCPSTRPAEGATCSDGTFSPAECTYGPESCRCGAQGWTCATCPATQPEESAPCGVNLDVCDYGDATCTCQGAEGWDCLTPCPTAQPTAGDVCHISPNAVCTYGSTTCECVNQVYFCS